MLTFSDFLTENFLTEALGATINSNGVAFETNLMKKTNGGAHPEKHENEEGLSPAEAHEKHHGSLSPEHQKSVIDGAEHAHNVLREHLHNIGFAKKTEPLNVHWTSKAGQVSKVTGNGEDRNNPGDSVITNKKGEHRALSLKYGSKPGLRSPGLKDLSKLMGTKHDQEKIDTHKKELKNMMGPHVTAEDQKTRNNQFREAEKNPKAAKHVAVTREASKVFRTSMAKDYTQGFNSLSHEQHHDTVRRLLNAEPSGTPVIKVHHDPKKNKTEISDPVDEFKNIHANTHHYSAEHRGTSTYVYSHTHDGQKHHIATVNIKDKSSPMTTIGGSVSPGTHYKKAVEATKKPENS